MKESDGWCTPRSVADLLGEFDLDVASNDRSHVRAKRSYRLERGEDGLALPWVGSVWCNGPYSAPKPWCERLAKYDGPWCALWKYDPTTKWWRALLSHGAHWAPFHARLKFERPDKPPLTANFVSVLVWRDWRPSDELIELLRDVNSCPTMFETWVARVAELEAEAELERARATNGVV